MSAEYAAALERLRIAEQMAAKSKSPADLRRVIAARDEARRIGATVDQASAPARRPGIGNRR